MATRTLSRDNIDFGRFVLLATDSVGLSPEGAFWIADSNDNRWDFYLVTSMFDRIGSRELYLRLHDVLSEKLSKDEAANLEIYIAGPDESLVSEVRKVVATKDSASFPHSFDVKLGDRDANLVVYRMAEPLGHKSAKRAERVFRKLSDEFVPV